MKSIEKEITYQSTNSYSTLNSLTDHTRNVWFVCHGMGYLSRFFLKYFTELNVEENYIIAPQAQSKYYMPPKFKHVGASWLTRENTLSETENVLRYFDTVWEAESIPDDVNLIILGYSQGVSVSLRWVARRQIQCHQLVMMSGGIPKELLPVDFEFMQNVKVSHIYGIEDEYLNEERIAHETQRSKELFRDNLEIIPFEGNHVVNVELINSLV
ncbi:MAG: esterase [Flavobacteriaceae bacterium]|nr:esterase [Bacteroidia bacterium]NNK27317.1 esterase [Flavobacteriaceae bacterium]NNL61835.1 esterase [Flavobacteriaceae bacterium]RZV64263.1 MAG: esterase [Flavobacteriaceae bacterium]